MSARLLGEGVDILLVSRKGMSLRFTADDAALRPMGRATSGVTGMRFRDDDQLLSMDVVRDVDDDSDVLLVSRKGMSIRFTASDEALRPMGRSTSGVIGMHFRGDDELLSASVVSDPSTGSGQTGYVFVVTEGGYAKRTSLDQYRLQNRGGLGIKVAKLSDERGDLVGAMIVGADDEVLVVMERGKVVRSSVSGVPAKGRDTMGVVFAKPDGGDRIIAVARNTERVLGDDDLPAVVPGAPALDAAAGAGIDPGAEQGADLAGDAAGADSAALGDPEDGEL